MAQPPDPQALPPGVRFLKALVIVLTLTMILGLITVVAVIVIRVPAALTAGPALPDRVVLPDGLTAAAVTYGRGVLVVLAEGEGGQRVLVYAPDGRLRGDLALEGEGAGFGP